MMSLEVDYADLKEVMSRYDPLDELRYFLDRETGKVLVIDDEIERQARALADLDETEDPVLRLAWCILWQDLAVGTALPADEETATGRRVEALLARYVAIPTADSHQSYQDRADFVRTVADPHLQEMLEIALAGKGAFRRFKDVLLRYPQEQQRWFAFEDRRLQQRVDAWLRLCGLAGAVGEASRAPEIEAEAGTSEGLDTGEGRTGLVVLNFAHPLTPHHRQQIETLTGQPVARVIAINSQIDREAPLVAQVRGLADRAGLSPREWQTLPLLINPPALNFIAVTLLAELHGRCGYFPTHLSLRPIAGSTPTRYEVAEVINLQAIRDRARERR